MFFASRHDYILLTIAALFLLVWLTQLVTFRTLAQAQLSREQMNRVIAHEQKPDAVEVSYAGLFLAALLVLVAVCW